MTAILNFANTNSLWASFLVEVISRAGVSHAVVSPGSRSAPLAHALAVHPEIRAIPILDERSAAFFALGLARKNRTPVALICTSGTAAANFYPALIEARESKIPLLVLTADRPPELRDCASGQTIDQVKIFGHYPRWQAEVALPEASEAMLSYLRQTLRHACERTQWPVVGPVHLNIPFRDPLAPIEDGSTGGVDRERVSQLLDGMLAVERREPGASRGEVSELVQMLKAAKRPILVAGPALPANCERYCEAVQQFSRQFCVPVFADALSPVRQRGLKHPYLVEVYDFLLERNELPEGAPDLVLRLGALPTSKRLRRWLSGMDCPQWIVEEGDQNVDPLHAKAFHVRAGVTSLLEEVCREPFSSSDDRTAHAEAWAASVAPVRAELATAMAGMEEMFEGKVAWVLSRFVPPGATLFLSNSTPIRDAEFFWQPREQPVDIFFNRGANGIDGIVSTAMGVASGGGSVFLLTGDLAFLHDQNGLLNGKWVRGGLTIVLINNNGGGIFQSLPVAQFDPPFEEFFATPQNVDFATLCAAYGIHHQTVDRWETLAKAIEAPWDEGIRVLEVRTDRRRDWAVRKRLLRGE